MYLGMRKHAEEQVVAAELFQLLASVATLLCIACISDNACIAERMFETAYGITFLAAVLSQAHTRADAGLCAVPLIGEPFPARRGE